MEQHLRALLHYCKFFGIYLGACKTNANQVPTFMTKAPNLQSKNYAWHDKTKSHVRNAFLQRLHVSLLLSALCVIFVYGIYWRKLIPGLMLTWVAATLIFTSQMCTHFVIIIEAVCKKSQHEHFLAVLDEIEVALKLRLRQDVQQVKLFSIIRFHLVYLVAGSFTGFIVFIITSIWLTYVAYFWHGLWSIITLRLRIIQLMIYVRTLQHYLECLCEKLRQIEAYRMAPEQRMLDINYEKLDSLEYLLAIKEIYALLHKAFQLLNNFAGWSLFSIITSYVFNCSCNLYWTLLSFDGYVRRRHYYIAGPAAMLPLIAIIWHLCYLCDNCKKLGHTVAHLLSKIMIMSSAKSLGPYRLTLYQLSTQLQLQRIEVTGQNVFVLEMRLLMMIFTAVAMNLVILTQFLRA